MNDTSDNVDTFDDEESVEDVQSTRGEGNTGDMLDTTGVYDEGAVGADDRNEAPGEQEMAEVPDEGRAEYVTMDTEEESFQKKVS